MGVKIHGEEKIFLYFFDRGQATQLCVFVALIRGNADLHASGIPNYKEEYSRVFSDADLTKGLFQILISVLMLFILICRKRSKSKIFRL